MSSDVCLIEFLIFGGCLTRFGPTSRTQSRYLERPFKSYHVMQKLSTSRKNTDALTQSKKVFFSSTELHILIAFVKFVLKRDALDGN